MSPSWSIDGKGSRDMSQSLYMGKLSTVPAKDIPGPIYEVLNRIESPSYSFGPNKIEQYTPLKVDTEVGDKIGPGSYYSKADISFGNNPQSTKTYSGSV